MPYLNSIQFWSGDDPIKSSELENDGLTKVARFGDVAVRCTPTIEGTAVTYERHGIIERRATNVSGAAGYRLVDEGGAALVEAEYTVDGTVTVLDHDCQVVQRSSDQLRSIVQGHGAILNESEAPQVGCRYVNLVRPWRTGRLCDRSQRDWKKVVALPCG